MGKIILASSSPRRMELLKNLGVEFDIIPSNYEEIMVNKQPEELVCYLAKNKALEVSNRVKSDNIVLAADTMVFIGNIALGKPHTNNAAYAMLKNLSGKVHEVITGICLINKSINKTYLDYEVTKVFFRELSEEEILNYIETKEPLDKAGAYGIQGLGGLFVKRIEGCYFNVVGLPIYKLYNGFREMGVNLLARDV